MNRGRRPLGATDHASPGDERVFAVLSSLSLRAGVGSGRGREYLGGKGAMCSDGRSVMGQGGSLNRRADMAAFGRRPFLIEARAYPHCAALAVLAYSVFAKVLARPGLSDMHADRPWVEPGDPFLNRSTAARRGVPIPPCDATLIAESVR